jgi:hypothetical protein
MRRPGGRSWIWAAASAGLVFALSAPAGARADPAKPPAHAASHKAHKSPGRHARLSRTRRRGDGVTALADCYGRFIAWRDELSNLMLQANSYTPWPDDQVRFDRMERAFGDGARKDRNLVLTLQPSFREADFPRDVRSAFRAGLKTGSTTFAAGGYRYTQLTVLGRAGLSPRQRMAELEANADQAFAPLSASCERLTGP